MFFSEEKPSASLRIRMDNVIKDFRHGIHRSVMGGSGLEFLGLRDYHHGDPISRIDWTASARLSDGDTTFVVRDYHQEREIGVLCAVDVGESMQYPSRKWEYSRLLAWLFALSAFKLADRFQALLFDECSIRSSEWGYTEGWLQEASFEERPMDLFRYFRGAQMQNTLLIFISDFNQFKPESLHQIRTLEIEEKNIRCLFIALDEFAGFKPLPFRAAFLDPVRGKGSTLDLRKEMGGEMQRAEESFQLLMKKARLLDAPVVRVPLIENDPLAIVQKALLKEGFE